MPTTPEAAFVPPPADIAAVAALDHATEIGARRSERRSIERRAAGRQARRRRLTGRGSAMALMGVMAIGSAGALAQERTGGASATATASQSAGSASTVAAIQRALGVPADGVMGPKTRRALRSFQRRKGLAVDGVAGPVTLAALGVRARSASTLTSKMPASTRGKSGASAVLARIAQCESGGNPAAISASGRYRGKYQFSRATWRALGGKGDPAKAAEAEQDRLAAALYARSGASSWPSCGR